MRPGAFPGDVRPACALIVLVLTIGTAAVGSVREPEDPRIGLRAGTVVASAPVRLDGVMSEPVWEGSQVAREFRQREPNEGAPCSLETEARIAYDSAALYVGVRAYDPEPQKIAGLLTRRDSGSPSDWIRILVDSYHDRRSAFEFAVNPAGVKQDRYWFNDGQGQDSGWDAVWDVGIHKDEKGWGAEFRIPFSQLRFTARNEATFGIAVVREIARLKEVSTWPLLAKSAHGYVSSFGELTGLTLSSSPERLELVPYAVAQIDTAPQEPDNPLAKSVDPSASGGLDLKYAIRPSLTLTATINPDFGQVEADPAVVNLSAFEVFFPERRPFFVENSEIFRFDTDCNDGMCTGLFYSRRIGRPPQIEADAPDEAYVSAPAFTTILGAAKVTGRLAGFSIGALNAVTTAEYAAVADGAQRHDTLVEPATSYSVLRARKDFPDQSSLGFMLTATNRRLTDSVQTLPDQAYTGGVDWDWRLGKLYSLSGYWAGSNVQGAPEAIDLLQTGNTHLFQRPDAGYLDYDPSVTQMRGQSFMVSMSKIGGERVRFNSNFSTKSPGFDVNDLGFMRRADERSVSNWLQIRHDRPWKHLRSFRINFNQWAGWNYGGEMLFKGGNVNAHAVFTNNWSTGIGVNFNGRTFDDRLSRGGPGGYMEGSTGIWQYFSTDDRRAVSGGNSLFWMDDRHGSRRLELNPEVTVRPSSSLSLAFGPRYARNHDDSQWLENLEDEREHYVFGCLRQTTVALTTRFNYTITPTLSLQLYAEPFVSAGRYSNFKELVDGRAERYENRFSPYDYASNPDFRYTSFRSTTVLRWEYRPGSTVFVVWQQGREEYLEGQGNFRFGRDFGHVFGTPACNTFLVKFAYWFNY